MTTNDGLTAHAQNIQLAPKSGHGLNLSLSFKFNVTKTSISRDITTLDIIRLERYLFICKLPPLKCPDLGTVPT